MPVKNPRGGHLKEPSNAKIDMSLSRHCIITSTYLKFVIARCHVG